MLWSKVTYCTEKCCIEEQSSMFELGLPEECRWKQRIKGRLSKNINAAPQPGHTGLLGNEVCFNEWLQCIHSLYKILHARWVLNLPEALVMPHRNFKWARAHVRYDMRLPVSRLPPPSQTTDLSSCQTQCGVCSPTRPDLRHSVCLQST